MKTRHVLAVLAITGGLLFLSACGDDNDTRPPQGPPTNTPVPPPPPTSTNTALPAQSPTPTKTPEVGVTPSPTTTGGPGFEASFTCDIETAYVCASGPNTGKPCRPVCHLEVPGESCLPAEVNFCGGGKNSCKDTKFFCKGGPTEGASCTPPRLDTDPNPCGEGGRCQNSELTICTELACPNVNQPVAGNTRVKVTCAKDGCRGELLLSDSGNPFSGFDPVPISGIGLICVRPVSPGDLSCPIGRVDCDGGALLDYDLIQDHNIGDCSTNAQCIQMCQAYCQAMDPPRTVAESGCAGYCEGGIRDGQTCGCDRVNIQCAGFCCTDKSGTSCNDTGCNKDKDCKTAPYLTCGGTDCPDGSCVGKDNPEGENRDICGCQCLETGGQPGGPGELNFQIPGQIIVESESDDLCGVGPVLITLPPQCIPFTTESMAGVLINANNTPGRQIPKEGQLVRHGRRVDCTTLQTGDVSAMDIVGNISFFDSSIGDIEVELDWFCK